MKSGAELLDIYDQLLDGMKENYLNSEIGKCFALSANLSGHENLHKGKNLRADKFYR